VSQPLKTRNCHSNPIFYGEQLVVKEVEPLAGEESNNFNKLEIKIYNLLILLKKIKKA